VSPGTDLTKVNLKVPNQDVEIPLRTVGATTASIVVGAKIGWIIALLDILKGFLPTLTFRLLFPGTNYFLIFGLAVIAGHIWPIFYKFRGGGGLAATIGFLTAIDVLGVWVSAFIVVILGLFVFHETVITFLGGPWIFLIWITIRTGNLWYILANLTANLLIIIASIPDIREGLVNRKIDSDISTGVNALPLAKPFEKITKFFHIKGKKSKR
jgi:glycerol-3-phosphate acyltransferase PlsY